MRHFFDYTANQHCVNLKVSTRYDGHQIRWKFGECSSRGKYADDMTYIHRCCLEPGDHTLTCINTKEPHGWKQGFIEIEGNRYCHDFMGYKAMRRIAITSMKY